VSDHHPPIRSLPAYPSLEQLRKQAKDLLREHRSGSAEAARRLSARKPGLVEPKLADAQFVIAREHGFESWPKLAHHVAAAAPRHLGPYERMAEDVLAADGGDAEASRRLGEQLGRVLSQATLRDLLEQHRSA